MPLPIDFNSNDYRFYKTLNEDVQLVSNENGFFDLNMINEDYVNVTGNNSLLNACIIAIMTRYGELKENPMYQDFGCHVHELIKDNQTKMLLFKLEAYISDVLSNMRRVKTVNSINIAHTEVNGYKIQFEITSINDEIVAVEMEI